MTSLVGASVLLIAGSALALIFGWVTADESLIWTSIAASVASGVALALAYGRARQELPATKASPATKAPPATKATPTKATPTEATPTEAPPTKAEESLPDVVSEPPPVSVARDEVVGVPHTKRFHKTTCRYAGTKNAASMARGDAVQRGMKPCGICKP